MNQENVSAERPAKKLRKIVLRVFLIIIIVGVPSYYFMNSRAVADPENTASWKEYSSHEKGFAVTFLGKPKKDIDGSGNLTATLFNSTSKDGLHSYNVTVADVPTNISSGSQVFVTEYIKSRKKGVSNLVVKGTKSGGKEGFSYTETTFTGTVGGVNKTFRVRAGFANNKLYGLFTVGNGEEAANSSFFLDSFKPV